MYGTELSLHKYETDLQVEWQKESDIKTVSAQKTYLFLILKNYVQLKSFTSNKHILIKQIKSYAKYHTNGHCHIGRKYMYRYVFLERKADLF